MTRGIVQTGVQPVVQSGVTPRIQSGRIALACGLLFASAAAVAAQSATQAAQNESHPEAARGTELGVVAGVASTSTHTGLLGGGTAGWNASPWLVAEARAAWLDRGAGASAFTADLGASVHPKPWGRLVPYAGAGFGLYRASFESGGATMSPFYRRRFGTGTRLAANGGAFNDPMLRLTAGIELWAGRNVWIRPEASALLVWDGGRRETTGAFVVRVGYRFEDRPITPNIDRR